jgi:O-antigen/teichoic acid export membrane protein
VDKWLIIFNRDLDVLIIGKFFGADTLGGYSLAKQLAKRPLSIINPIINRVAISILPRYQNDETLLLKYFNRLINNLSFINAFIYGFIAISAPLIIYVLYGNDYLYITPVVRLFTIVIYFRSVSSLVGVLSITKGRTDLEFYWNLIIAFVMPIVIFIGVNESIEIIVLLLAVAQFLLIFPSWYMFYLKQINMPLLGYVRSILIPFFIAGIIYMLYYFTGIESKWFQVFASGFLFVFLIIFFVKTNKSVLVYIKENKYITRFINNK